MVLPSIRASALTGILCAEATHRALVSEAAQPSCAGCTHANTAYVQRSVATEHHSDRILRLPRSGVASPIRLTGLRVLLVEDDVDQLAMIAELLAEARAEVDTATSAHDAIRALSLQVPDVIVSDINMPDCDGYHLLRMVRARSTQQGGATPAIALTGSATPADRTRALLASYQIHLAKPIQPLDLLIAIRSLVDARSTPAGARLG